MTPFALWLQIKTESKQTCFPVCILLVDRLGYHDGVLLRAAVWKSMQHHQQNPVDTAKHWQAAYNTNVLVQFWRPENNLASTHITLYVLPRLDGRIWWMKVSLFLWGKKSKQWQKNKNKYAHLINMHIFNWNCLLFCPDGRWGDSIHPVLIFWFLTHLLKHVKHLCWFPEWEECVDYIRTNPDCSDAFPPPCY